MKKILGILSVLTLLGATSLPAHAGDYEVTVHCFKNGVAFANARVLIEFTYYSWGQYYYQQRWGTTDNWGTASEPFTVVGYYGQAWGQCIDVAKNGEYYPIIDEDGDYDSDSEIGTCPGGNDPDHCEVIIDVDVGDVSNN